MGKKNKKNKNRKSSPGIEKDTSSVAKDSRTDDFSNDVYIDEDLFPSDDAEKDEMAYSDGAEIASCEKSAEDLSCEKSADEERTSGSEQLNEGSDDSLEEKDTPKHDIQSPKKNVSEITSSYLARLIIVLCLVCALVAGLLATVNAVTKDKISEHNMIAKKKAVLEAFPVGTDCGIYENEAIQNEVYLVYYNSDIVGYCVYVSEQGFGGSVDMMVGIDSLKRTVGVSIVSMSETPGVGTKVKTADFLSQFEGKDGNVKIGTDVDAISGATISSTAVTQGVKSAHAVNVDLEKAASEKGLKVLNIDDIGKTDTSPETSEPKQTEPKDTDNDQPETTDAQTDVEFNEAYRRSSYGYNVYAEQTDPVYRIEIEKSLYTDLLEKKDETEKETDKKPAESKKTEAPSEQPNPAPNPEPKPNTDTTSSVQTEPPETKPIDSDTIDDTDSLETNPDRGI